MHTHNTALVRGAGLLILLATATYIAGSALLDPLLNAPDPLAAAGDAPSRVLVAVLLEYVCAFSVVGVAVLLYPLLHAHAPLHAASYLVTRTVEAVLLLVSGVVALALVPLAAANVDGAALGVVLAAQSGLSYQVAMLALGLGSVVFCVFLWQTQLVPRWLALAGVVGYAALVASVFVALAGYEDLSLYLYGPGALFEIAFPLWLIVRGVATPAPHPHTPHNPSPITQKETQA